MGTGNRKPEGGKGGGTMRLHKSEYQAQGRERLEAVMAKMRQARADGDPKAQDPAWEAAAESLAAKSAGWWELRLACFGVGVLPLLVEAAGKMTDAMRRVDPGLANLATLAKRVAWWDGLSEDARRRQPPTALACTPREVRAVELIRAGCLTD